MNKPVKINEVEKVIRKRLKETDLVLYQYKKDAFEYYNRAREAIEQRGYYIDFTERSRTNWTAQDEVKHSLKVN